MRAYDNKFMSLTNFIIKKKNFDYALILKSLLM